MTFGRRLVASQPIRPPPLRQAYSIAASTLCIAALRAVPGAATSEKAVFGSTALALCTDLGPSAARDLARSDSASAVAIDGLIAASPRAILVDNFATPLEEANEEERLAASTRLAAAHRFALLVRGRIVGDSLGVLLMLRPGRASLGAALIMASHAIFWICGGAAARVDAETAAPAPLSPPLAKLVCAVVIALSAAAACGAGWVYSSALTLVQAARLLADRVRDRIHVGL